MDAVNTESVDCVRQPSPFPGPVQVGYFCWDDAEVEGVRYLYIRMPGQSGPDAIRCFRGPDRGIPREWSWDGNEDKPTLSPSLHDPGIWHGHLVAGRLVSC